MLLGQVFLCRVCGAAFRRRTGRIQPQLAVVCFPAANRWVITERPGGNGCAGPRPSALYCSSAFTPVVLILSLPDPGAGRCAETAVPGSCLPPPSCLPVISSLRLLVQIVLHAVEADNFQHSCSLFSVLLIVCIFSVLYLYIIKTFK